MYISSTLLFCGVWATSCDTASEKQHRAVSIFLANLSSSYLHRILPSSSSFGRNIVSNVVHAAHPLLKILLLGGGRGQLPVSECICNASRTLPLVPHNQMRVMRKASKTTVVGSEAKRQLNTYITTVPPRAFTIAERFSSTGEPYLIVAGKFISHLYTRLILFYIDDSLIIGASALKKTSARRLLQKICGYIAVHVKTHSTGHLIFPLHPILTRSL
ncbi:hypothetical protein DFH09DRAFT_1281357 [Mycena vulgaris]|nr:hypothetical protein DFH09DRAFT_1281357 [Mycena vulgaris]